MPLASILVREGVFPCLAEHIDDLFSERVEMEVAKKAIGKKGPLLLSEMPRAILGPVKPGSLASASDKTGMKPFHILQLPFQGYDGREQILSINLDYFKSQQVLATAIAYHRGEYQIVYSRKGAEAFMDALKEEEIDKLHWKHYPLGFSVEGDPAIKETSEKKGQRIKKGDAAPLHEIEEARRLAFSDSLGRCPDILLGALFTDDPFFKPPDLAEEIGFWEKNAGLYVPIAVIALDRFQKEMKDHIATQLNILESVWKFYRLRTGRDDFSMAAGARSANSLANTAYHNMRNRRCRSLLAAVRGGSYRSEIRRIREDRMKGTEPEERQVLGTVFDIMEYGLEMLRKDNILEQVYSFRDSKIEENMTVLNSGIRKGYYSVSRSKRP